MQDAFGKASGSKEWTTFGCTPTKRRRSTKGGDGGLLAVSVAGPDTAVYPASPAVERGESATR
jgi:hypothetical protein